MARPHGKAISQGHMIRPNGTAIWQCHVALKMRRGPGPKLALVPGLGLGRGHGTRTSSKSLLFCQNRKALLAKIHIAQVRALLILMPVRECLGMKTSSWEIDQISIEAKTTTKWEATWKHKQGRSIANRYRWATSGQSIDFSLMLKKYRFVRK